jgi:hypothetical protein
MALSTLHPASHVAAGKPYINLSTGMQWFYARRGMWYDDAPAGMLAAWLGERCPWKSPGYTESYWTTPGGLLALYRDARAAPPQAWQTYHQCAQFLRRLREAAIRAGLPPDPDCWASGTAPQRPAAQRAPSPTSAPAVPFELRVPPAGRAREAFIRHVADVTRDFVTFTQGSAYTEAAAP